MTARLSALLVILLLVSACSVPGRADPSGFTEGASGHVIKVGGSDRSYRVYLPAGLAASAPLVVMLHGGFGSAEQAERSYGWNQLADSAKFVVAYPDGAGRAWNVGGGCCGRSGRDGVDDIGFIVAMVSDIARTVGIDATRVYATGISNGGMMSYALACNTDLFAAIGPDSATQLDGCAAPRRTSVLHIHGMADRMIRYDGEQGDGFARIDGPPVAEVNAFWRNVNRCIPPVASSVGAVTTSTAQCAAGRAVELITIEGAGHQWPGSIPIRAGGDPPSTALNATAEFWQFFAAHPRVQ